MSNEVRRDLLKMDVQVPLPSGAGNVRVIVDVDPTMLLPREAGLIQSAMNQLIDLAWSYTSAAQRVDAES